MRVLLRRSCQLKCECFTLLYQLLYNLWRLRNTRACVVCNSFLLIFPMALRGILSANLTTRRCILDAKCWRTQCMTSFSVKFTFSAVSVSTR